MKMGRKRNGVEMSRVTFIIPKALKMDLKEAGVNITQLFIKVAQDLIEKRKKK